MSLPALALAVEALWSLDPLEDDEFGLAWEDLGGMGMVVTWAMYESVGAGMICGVKSVRPFTLSEFSEVMP